MFVIVNVHLKSEILDPQGRAVHSALKMLGLSDVSDVRQGKQFVFKFEKDLRPEQINKIEELSKQLLSNPIIEDYSIEVKNDS